ncbi:MAG: hypothetical protein RL328_2968, partial [Acidobacteriota bacterium]
VNAHLPQTPVPGTIALRIKDADGVWPDARTLALARAPDAIPMVGVGSGP